MNNNITPLVDDLRQIINEARNRVAVNVNAELTLMYWHIGERINREVLGNERAEYGKQIVAAVSRQLQDEFGAKGFEERNIRRMMDFANLIPDFQIVSTLSTQLSWSHIIEILLKRAKHALSPQVETKWYPVGQKACLLPIGCNKLLFNKNRFL